MSALPPLPIVTACPAVGEPLADAVIGGPDVHGERARRALDAGLGNGLAHRDEESLHAGVADHAGARRPRDPLGSTTAAPDDSSRALTLSMFDAQAHARAGAPGAVPPGEQLRDLMHSPLRRAFEDETADHPGIPAPAAAVPPRDTALRQHTGF